MKEEISSFLNQISIELNCDLTTTEDHAWVVPSSAPEQLLTITWARSEEQQSYEFTFSLALGEYSELLPPTLLLDLMTSNMAMAILNGPKLSYSPKSNLLVLMDSLKCGPGDEVFIGEATDQFVAVGKQICEQIKATGVTLTMNLGQ